MQRRAINVLMRKSDLILVERIKRYRERPKITLVEEVKNGIVIKEITKSTILNKIEWWRRIHVANSNWSHGNPSLTQIFGNNRLL